MKLCVIVAAATLSAALALPGGAATITNGSFEDGSFTNAAFDTLGAGNTSITGWSIDKNSIDWIGSYWQPSEGRRSLDMDGLAPGTISQMITDLIVGTTYRIFFDIAGNTDGGPVVKSLTVNAGSSSGIYTFDTTGKSHANMGWTTHSIKFTAGATSELLAFSSNSDPNTFAAYGPALDNVTIAAVPLPAAAPLLGAGLAALAMLRRRRRA